MTLVSQFVRPIGTSRFLSCAADKLDLSGVAGEAIFEYMYGATAICETAAATATDVCPIHHAPGIHMRGSPSWV